MAEHAKPMTVDDTTASTTEDEVILRLQEETLSVGRRMVETGKVHIETVVRSRDQIVDEALLQEEVEVVRVPKGETVETAPPVRQDGDTLVIPLVEEVVVVERRLVLREELHVRRKRTEARHQETVTLRSEDAVVTRAPLAGDRTDEPLTREPHHAV